MNAEAAAGLRTSSAKDEGLVAVLDRVAPTAAEDVYGCPNCGFVYSEAAGAPREGFPAGTSWAKVPDDWACPDCGVREKADFVKIGG
ncbi:rubredoxin [Gordonia iterans]|uniref:rubredoxin n=1 Tax=Gordonia iterans TaxID=1004901 RepID=UPI002D78BE27|nr:rubredoxin [Gordonia iterans]